MTDDYTPTTEEVRNCYVENSARARKIREEQFRRWLRKVKAEAWEEAHRCEYIFDEHHEKFCGNPYRD